MAFMLDLSTRSETDAALELCGENAGWNGSDVRKKLMGGDVHCEFGFMEPRFEYV